MGPVIFVLHTSIHIAARGYPYGTRFRERVCAFIEIPLAFSRGQAIMGA